VKVLKQDNYQNAKPRRLVNHTNQYKTFA